MTRPASAHSASILFAVFIPIPAFLFATNANCAEPVQEPPSLQIVLRPIHGKENGGTELLNNRFQELTKRTRA